MKKRNLVLGFMLIMLLAMSTGLMAYSGGSGTSVDPYQITTAVWDGKDINGKQVSSGVYCYKLITNTTEYQKKMLLVK